MKAITIIFMAILAAVGCNELQKQSCTQLIPTDETLLVFSTLEGGLIALDRITGNILWNAEDDPPIMADPKVNIQEPYYLSDPKDGSIYVIGSLGRIKKLPFTIPELVSSAPCRSPEGILYLGKKMDTWFSLDLISGNRTKVASFSNTLDFNTENDLGSTTPQSVFLARTEYAVMVYNSLTEDKSNITFHVYSSHTSSKYNEYEFIHLTTANKGLVVTLDRKNGNFLWKKDLPSPVVAAYLLNRQGLLSIPFTTVSDEAMNTILEECKYGDVKSVKLFPMVYVGEQSNGLYAISSLASENTSTIVSNRFLKLLDSSETKQRVTDTADISVPSKNALILGHYEMPKTEYKQNMLSFKENKSSNDVTTLNTSVCGRTLNTYYIKELGIESNRSKNSSDTLNINDRPYASIYNWLINNDSKIYQLFILLILSFITICFCMWHTTSEITSQKKFESMANDYTYESVKRLISLNNGHFKVGKITLDTTKVLGKGCDGTFVFEGRFENRNVAVKRILPDYFTLANREVALLRESDTHKNVVRYFCTEQDEQFRYIALELCAATLQDYTEGEKSHEFRLQIDSLDVLRQATCGLAHLHSLKIVHRDIKPQNILISLPNASGTLRVMISDFGLCKKLSFGKASFSQRSGLAGTDGWIAPELLNGQRTTTSVDIFSLGCVYYYVISKGYHAFGELLNRQANIQVNSYNLSNINTKESALLSKAILAEQLIADMIHKEPENRPPANCVGKHPVFWSNEKILSFLQEVSDRVEKIPITLEPLRSLEFNSHKVIMEDWNKALEQEITEDLRKHRGYAGSSVRDLLRAVRNKKHHYHELSTEVQNILGAIPVEFTNYWIEKFPQLLSHAYHAFTFCANENSFKPYYCSNYIFSKPTYFEEQVELSNEFETFHQVSTAKRKPRFRKRFRPLENNNKNINNNNNNN